MTEVFYWFGATLIFGGVLIAGLAIAAMKSEVAKAAFFIA